MFTIPLFDSYSLCFPRFPCIKLQSEVGILCFRELGVEDFSHALIFFDPLLIFTIQNIQIQELLLHFLWSQSICSYFEFDTFRIIRIIQLALRLQVKIIKPSTISTHSHAVSHRILTLSCLIHPSVSALI